MGEERRLNHRQRVVLRLFLTGSYEHVKRLIQKFEPAEIAEIFGYLRKSDQLTFLSLLFQLRLAGETLSELPEELAKELIHAMTDEQIKEMLRRVPPDDAVDLLDFLSKDRQEKILESMSQSERWELEKLIIYDADSAGGIMTTEYVALNEDTPVTKALEILRQKFAETEIYYIYVVDERGHLVGLLPLHRLVMADPEKKVKEIMVPDPISVPPHIPQEEVARIVSDFDLLAIPVVDEDHKLLGIVTFDDVIDVVEEEATKDIYLLANLDTEERVFTPVAKSVRLRVGWLLVNLITAILAALTVSLFSATISRYVVLAVLMPIVAGMGGNAGTQSLTVVVRGLALGEVSFSTGWKAILKEVVVGLINGLLMGLVMGIIAFLWYHNLWLSIVMIFAMVVNLIIAGLFGAAIPLILKWLKQDPALASSIFVTTATDVGGFFVFLGLASMFLTYITGA